MKPQNQEPTRDQLTAMAYADGELAEAERHEFELRMAGQPSLGRLVSEYQALEILAREMAPPEPADFEWSRLETDLLQRTGSRLGWLLFAGGSMGLAGWGIWSVAVAEMEALPKLLALSSIAGALLLLLMAIRARLRLLPYDPYRKVQR